MNSEVIDTLNDLIETSKDGEKGFERAAKDTTDTELKSIFAAGAQRCRNGAAELQQLVRSLGGDPEKGGTALGAVHRGWVDLKSAVTGRDAKAIVSEVERGEDYAKARYSAALKKDLPVNVRELVQRQHQGVLANHDQVRALRDRYT